MQKRKVYDRIARLYDLLDLPFERRRYAPIRKIMWAGVAGRVLDCGVGTGRNMAYYPVGDEHKLTGIDLSPAMLGRAAARKRRLGIEADLHEMNALATTFDNDTFDVVVATFLFCVLEAQDQTPALNELARICKPGGEVHILEYALPADPTRRFIMKLWAPWVRWAYGASFDRKTEEHVADSDLEMVSKRFLHEDIIKLLVLRPR